MGHKPIDNEKNACWIASLQICKQRLNIGDGVLYQISTKRWTRLELMSKMHEFKQGLGRVFFLGRYNIIKDAQVQHSSMDVK